MKRRSLRRDPESQVTKNGSRGIWHGLHCKTAGNSLQRTGGYNLHQQFTEIELVLHQRGPQIEQSLRTISSNRLFDDKVKQLLHQRVVRFLAVGQESC